MASEIFSQIKKQANSGLVEISLSELDDRFSQIQGFFNDFSLDLANVTVLSENDNYLKIKAFSKDFLFKKTVFKNESVSIEADFNLKGDKIELLAICKLNKAPKKLSKLPGIIGDILKPLDFIEVSDLVYVITTNDIKVIASESFPEYDKKTVNFKPGINLAGFIDLKNSGNVVSLITKPLKPVIGEGPYFMSWNMKDKFDIDFSLNLPQDINIESLFKIKQPKLVIKPINPVQISIDGLFDIQLPPLINVSVLGGFSYNTDGVRGKFNLDKVAEKIPAPFGYPGVHLTSMTVSAGISNGIANVGAEGNFYIGPNKPDNISNKPKVAEFGVASNQYKFIFDAVPGKITPKFFYLYLDKLTIEEYLKAISNQNIILPSFLNKISIEQVMFHWCENPLGETKPDGTIGMPIFGLSGITNIFGHRTFTELNTTPTETKGKLIADPINIGNGLLKITGNGKAPETYKGVTKIKPGGMELSFNSKGNPSYISFSTKIEILGLSGEIVGDVNDNGISGKVKSNIAGILKNDLALTLNHNNFDISTNIYAGITGLKVSLGKLGTINLDTYLEGGFSANYLNGKYTNKMRLHFMLVGVKFDLGELDIVVLDLKKIVQILEDYIKNAAKKLSENALAWLTATIEEIVNFVGDKLEQIGKALSTEFNKTLENGAELMRKVGYQAKEVADALNKGYHATKEELARALKQAGYLAQEIGEALNSVLGLSGKVVAEILKGIGSSAEEVARTLKDVFDFGTQKIGETMKALEFSANVVSQSLNLIKAPVEEVHKVLTDIFNEPDEKARKILEAVGYPAKVIIDNLPHIKSPIHIKHVKLPDHLKHIKSPVHLKHLKAPW
jgi:methyl-accepting chemotaxis protein